jgi:hypothetical protein
MDFTVGFIILYYIEFSAPKLVKMTVGCGICHTNTKMSIVQLKFSHKKTSENTVVTREAIKKYIHIV